MGNFRRSLFIFLISSSMLYPCLIQAQETDNDYWGYRFSITGDFNGDKNEDILDEVFISEISGEETAKWFPIDNFDSLRTIIQRKKPRSMLLSRNPGIDTLRMNKGANYAVFGIAWLKNEGDLDDNGTDEISFIVDYADFSSENTCRIYSFSKEGWKEMTSFPIHDWELPLRDLNGIPFQGQRPFEGFVKKIGKREISISTHDENGKINKTIKLKKLKKPKLQKIT